MSTPDPPAGVGSTAHDSPYDLLGDDHDDGHRWAFGTGFTDPLEGIDTSVPAGLDADRWPGTAWPSAMTR